jgi:Fur family peroxide stress response transcriptional regulator
MLRKSKEAILKELKIAGYRITKQRHTIIEIIADRQDHPSVRQIYNKIALNNPDISLATVYNTLNMLVDMKLLKELDFEKTDNRYETNLAPHINLVCTNCGNIIDFDYDLPVGPDIIREKEGFVTKEHRMEYRGICKTCQNKK